MHAHEKAAKDRSSPVRTASRPALRSSGAGQAVDSLMALQRSAGNAAVSRALGGGTLPVQRAPGDDPNRHVLSGHGRFGDQQLLPANPDNPRSRARTPMFRVPEGIELVVYTPPGASLENQVANVIESGGNPTTDELELVNDNNKRKPMPANYPRTFTAGQEVINFRVTPMEGRHLAPGAVSVTPGALRDKVHELAEAHQAAGPAAQPLVVHFACCGLGGSNNAQIDSLFEHRGWTVMLRATSPSPSPTPEPAAKRRK